MSAAAGVAAIVLAGGRSERFGRDDKLLVRIDGSTLLERAVAAVSHVARDVVVVLPPGAPAVDVPAPARAAHDPIEGEGPLAGVHAGLLEVVRSDVAVVVGGDMPRLQPPVLRSMIDVLADPAVELVALDDGEGARPLPIVVRTGPAVDAARTLLEGGSRRLRDLVASLRAHVIEAPIWTGLDPQRLTLRDVDVPGDLNR
ncbi:MAG TPA: molybdenum cofactor guanylyltransferase [Actinomycetota bacterium]|nr:molybdenum cofactor guanylyltransferase [Actinomycetota bacterium]